MLTHFYYPQIRWKAAEQEALSHSDLATLNLMRPIITIPDIDWNFVTNNYKKSLQAHLNDFGLKLANAWAINAPIYLDVSEIDKHASQVSHPLDTCIIDAQAYNKEIIPVYSPNYSSLYLASVMKYLKNGVALKFNSSNIAALQATCNHFNIPESDIDIILDIGDIQQSNDQLVGYLEQCMTYILSIGNFRRIIFSATSYPSSQSGIPQNVVHTLTRHEWLLWSKIITNNNVTRTPGFSDYPTSSTFTPPLDPRLIDPYVSIRYSDFNNWIFVKGTSSKGNGWGQTQNLCQILVSNACYKGQNYSWGDYHINARAQGTVTSGSSKDWRKVANNHHFRLVTEQLGLFAAAHPPRP
ncbi:beta family protein [Cronobacter dublinensis]|uniref:beta family protein n=1 Tax=Cronobacter malonaticus TaxID=413503 RepID=UPI0028943EAE|nr:hypothetical protein [Cronobacter malonaticus]MDT3560505.1 hypothetical protein [Cronobacter malonaticus]